MKSFTYTLCLFAFFVCTCFAMYDGKTGPVILNDNNFDEIVLNSGDAWIVEFYAPWCGHCKAMKDDYIKAAEAMSGIGHFGAVDATEEKALASKYQIKGFPTLLIFSPISKDPIPYESGRDVKSFCNAVNKANKNLIKARLDGTVKVNHNKPKASTESDKPKKETPKQEQKQKPQEIPAGNPADVIVLTDDNFESKVMDSKDIWMVKFYAPWCGHCKALAPEWIKAATAMKGKVHFAEVDATVHTDLASEYQIQGYPTIKVFGSGIKDASSVQDYNSERTAASLIAYATKLYEAYQYELENPLEVVEVYNQEKLDSICGDKTCLIAFLPHIIDSGKDKRNDLLKTLTTVATKQPRGLFTYGWIEGGNQYDLEQKLNLGFGYPAVVAISKSKGKYAVAKGAFTERAINVFITGLKSGSTRLSALPTLPEMVEVAPWDGEDAAPIEEDDADHMEL